MVSNLMPSLTLFEPKANGKSLSAAQLKRHVSPGTLLDIKIKQYQVDTFENRRVTLEIFFSKKEHIQCAIMH